MFFENEIRSHKCVEVRNFVIPVHVKKIEEQSVVEFYQHFLGIYVSENVSDYAVNVDDTCWQVEDNKICKLTKLYSIHRGELQEIPKNRWSSAIQFLCPEAFSDFTIQ